MEPDKARSRTTLTGQSQPSSYPATGQSQPPAALLLRLVPCLKALRATRVSVAGTIPISQAEYALAEPIKYNYKRQRAHMKSEPSTPCALFLHFRRGGAE